MYYILNVIYIGYQLQALSKISTNRLQKELMEWHVNPLAEFRDKVTDNEVNSAPGTLYANGTFQLQVDFSEHYPIEAPHIPILVTRHTIHTTE
ncbi:putative ubiquitin-conjugating enzyme E2, ubiquitin-conjugating enzyme/RWD [Helianthus annuus]|nr:putative ubiquitin-conjugating enzyme E2, ubiquitin-conjugating enzyme/RWD [Helianthus annuus]KAJ0778813.1 putative ubiquitin-conjugating enzyme E2, ubiquitin-conjugating enzyme/RWD [Helianthus annuus]